RDGFDPSYSIGWPVIAWFNYPSAQRRSSVRVADVQHASDISFYSHRSMHWAAQNATISRIAIVKLSDPLYVIAGLSKAWNASTAGHRARSGVICRETQADVTAVILHQHFQVTNPGIHVLLRIERIRDLQLPCG